MNEFHKMYGNIWLTEKQVNTLNKYNIKIENFKTTNELIMYLESFNDIEELDEISYELSEYNYYNFTNK